MDIEKGTLLFKDNGDFVRGDGEWLPLEYGAPNELAHPVAVAVFLAAGVFMGVFLGLALAQYLMVIGAWG